MFFQSKRFQQAILCLVFLCFAMIVGCGPGDQRQAVSGTVTWQDKPLAKGVITLYPKGAGSTVGCEIIDGSFVIALNDGATPGKYRVEIISFRPTGKTEFDVDQNKQVLIEEQFLPKQYNTDTSLEAIIAVGEKNRFEFNLKPNK